MSSDVEIERPGTVDGLEAPTFVEQSLSRNADVVLPHEQAVLRAMRVLVAGCGSVGGAVVEPLARLGVRSFVLADPERYEVTNLNRQGCYVADVGRPKAAVMAERVSAINPLAEVSAMTGGLTPENIPVALEDVTVVFDGIDAETSLWAKWCLHRDAALRRIPVLSGADFGGTPVVYVWDYRRDQRPFYGRARSEDHREGRYVESLRWLGLRSTPADWTDIMRKRALSGDPWPQVAYCTSALGAIGSRTILEVALGRDVRHVVRVDVHMLPRRTLARVKERARFPAGMARALAALREHPRGSPRQRTPAALPPLPDNLRAVLEAARGAPSPHNVQPWKLMLEGPAQIRLDWDRSRYLAAADPDAEALCYALGTAVEAMSEVAEIEFEPCERSGPLAPDWYAGTVRVGRVRDSYAEASAIVASRGTNRVEYLRQSVPTALVQRLEQIAAARGARAFAIDGRRQLARLGALVAEAATAQFSDPRFMAELLEWTRLSSDEEAASPDGFTAAGMRFEGPAVPLFRMLRARPGLRRAATRSSLPATMGRSVGTALEHSSVVLLFSLAAATPVARLEAGRALMAVWLEATRRGLAVQPVSVPLLVDAVRTPTLDLFGAAGAGEPMMLLRLGRAAGPPPPSPRLSLERICTVDRAQW